jgi:UPF0176 protein
MELVILLYYKYVNIVYPVTLEKAQRRLCEAHGLLGRILIATEGINGTLAGSREAVEAYKQAMREDERFADIDFKESLAEAAGFDRLQVKIKKEIVGLGIDPEAVKATDGGTHLSPEQTHDLLNNKPDNLVVLDARNWYESRVGAFRDAITPDIATFREFPEYLEKNKHLFEDKDVLMYCTGGVRCERASALLKQMNCARSVSQVSGGIHRYVEAFPDGHFRGRNYVFDNRMSMRVNNDVLTVCDLCGIGFDLYNNCTNAICNKQYICCDACLDAYEACCSPTCQTLVAEGRVNKRPPLPLLQQRKSSHALR